jgi:hypothetical protein
MATMRSHLHHFSILLAAAVSAQLGMAQAAPSEGTAGLSATQRAESRPVDAPSLATPSFGVSVKPLGAKPAWTELTGTQQSALQPLAPYWERLSEERKRKWLLISRNFNNLNPTDQGKLHRGMTEWVTLSQQQRIQARQTFNEIKKLSPEQKTMEWEAYQALSPEQKRKLSVVNPVRPAALATGKPSATPKLTATPRKTAITPPRMAEISALLHPNPQNSKLVEPGPKTPERSPYEDEPAE